MSGVEVLRAAKAADASLPAIMMTAFASTETAVEAMRLGACDYLIKPFDVDELKLKVREKVEARQLRQENVLLKRALNQPHVMAGIIGRSSTMLARVRSDRVGGQDHQHRARDRRIGHGQGAGRPRAALPLAAPRSAVRRAELRRAARDAARIGAVRPHARRVHRRANRPRRAWSRSRERGDDLPRRDRRDDADDAGQAAARPAGAAVPPRRRHRARSAPTSA